jgi:rhodanese-related sulfurtransferase
MNTTDLPQFQEFHLEGVKHITPEEALKAINNGQAILVDIREEDEMQSEQFHARVVLNHPMSVILDRLEFISKDQSIIVACVTGERSAKVTNLLNIQGYPSVANLDGGLRMWKLFGGPVLKSSSSEGGGCGCCCGSGSPESEGSCC